MKSSLFETLPKNVTVSRKKQKNINFDNNEINDSLPESEEENEFLKTKKFDLKNNPKFMKLLQNSKNEKNIFAEKINKNENSIKEGKLNKLKFLILAENEKFRISNYSNNSKEQIKILTKEKNQLQTNYSIDILKNKNYSTFQNLNNDYTINNSRFFDIGQADNFSILNSYDSLLNTHQKYTNDFFAESNVSFKNSFLKNMKNKTSFRNMRIIKNSFSQSSIHMNDLNPDGTKSNFNVYRRNSMENINFKKRISGLIFKSNTNYNHNNNEHLFNKNNHIFDIDEEKDYEEGHKNKTLNKMILNHLNKDSFTSKFFDKTLNKKKLKLELNLDDTKSYLSQKLIRDSKSKLRDNDDDNKFNKENDLQKIAEGFEIFPTERLTEKSAEYKVVTEIIENIKLHPNNSIKKIKENENNKKELNNNEKKNILTNEINSVINNKNIINNLDKNSIEIAENHKNHLQNRIKHSLNSSDDLIKRIKNNDNFKVDDLVIQKKNYNKNDDMKQKKNDLADSFDSNNSLFDTKVLKFNVKKNSNSPIKKKNSDNLIGSNRKVNKLEDNVNYNKITNQNSKFQIHSNYNLSIINRRERIVKNNEYLLYNKNLINSLPEIFFYSNKKKSSKEPNNKENSNSNKRDKLKSHDRYSIDYKNKLFEDSKKVPEFSIINYENKNVILKNKLDYTRNDLEFNKKRSPKPLTRNGTFELKNLFVNSFDIKERNCEDFDLKGRLSNNPNYLHKKFSNRNDFKESLKNDKDIIFDEENNNEEIKKRENFGSIRSKKLSQAGFDIINKKKSDFNNNGLNDENKGFSYKNSVSKNHFKVQNHAVIGAFAEAQTQNLEIIEKKINEYVEEYNKRFVDFSFKKNKSISVVNEEYKENLKKMREHILKLNP